MRRDKFTELKKTVHGGWGIGINSGFDEHDPFFYARTPGYWFQLRLPKWLLRPYRTKVVAGWDPATVARLGRDWYWDEDRREFAISLSDNHLNIAFGRQADDSTIDRRWGCFLPWNEWRFVGYRVYDLAGGLIYITPDDGERHNKEDDAARERAPRARFLFTDFDGEQIEASTLLLQREWDKGAGWFKWLSLFVERRTRRDLEIDFSKEVGPKKGSWKGGTTGHGIEVRPGELHEAAFRRYCAAYNLTFIGANP